MLKQNVERKLTHLFDSSKLNVYDSEVLNLGVGAPGPDLLQKCCDIFQDATAHCMNQAKKSNSSLIFQYGPTCGSYEARFAIAKYLTFRYSSEVKTEDLILTTGATQGLHLILSTLVDLSGFVFVDEVTYTCAPNVIKQFPALTLLPVKLNEDGVDLSELKEMFKSRRFQSKTKEFWGMYYTIPTYHNPTGILFSKSVCQGIIELAREYDVLICCDDVYNILHYEDGPSPKRLFAYDKCADSCFRGNVISNCSFSKIIGPGLRLGWLEVPGRIKPILESSGVLVSGGCPNNYTAGIVSSLIELGLAQKHVQFLCDTYKERMLATCAILALELPKTCVMLKPHGGYFIWIRLPTDTDASDFLQFCLLEEKIFFIAGAAFSVNNTAKNCFRIAISFHNKEKLIDGTTRLCSALKKYLNKTTVV